MVLRWLVLKCHYTDIYMDIMNYILCAFRLNLYICFCTPCVPIFNVNVRDPLERGLFCSVVLSSLNKVKRNKRTVTGLCPVLMEEAKLLQYHESTHY